MIKNDSETVKDLNDDRDESHRLEHVRHRMMTSSVVKWPTSGPIRQRNLLADRTHPPVDRNGRS